MTQDDPPRPGGVGLVLGAGGSVGGAFHAGVLAALEEATGWDPRQATVVVGTSAGSITGTGLRVGLSTADGMARAEDRPLSPAGARLMAGVGSRRAAPPLEAAGRRFRAPTDVAATLARAAARPFAARPLALLAGLLPDGAMGTEVISEGIAAVADQGWPDDPLWICAVRRRDGRRVVFGRGERPPLPAAVAASCAIPGFFRPVEVDGEAHIDGGAHSPTNADVVRDLGLDLVVVSSPMSLGGRGLRLAVDQPARRWARSLLAAEAAKLRRRGTAVVAFQPTADDVAVMGGDALDRSRLGPIARRARESTLRRLACPDMAERLAALRT
ncbi:patatin-like phospholipase family protein [Iamia majanohamensis]|uniref:Patatin-like phospholipase family protein n=1 Tax=Iamia majanohamensis TaxID=467976 RepID=A0AAE9Y7Z1_9ACTN|nr:patatin-like phospholipase family protein [Iamia majanohamensis]WCO66118.1 patatin-like phospholipase family protein [Iamia majanohamensis]